MNLILSVIQLRVPGVAALPPAPRGAQESPPVESGVIWVQVCVPRRARIFLNVHPRLQINCNRFTSSKFGVRSNEQIRHFVTSRPACSCDIETLEGAADRAFGVRVRVRVRSNKRPVVCADTFVPGDQRCQGFRTDQISLLSSHARY